MGVGSRYARLSFFKSGGMQGRIGAVYFRGGWWIEVQRKWKRAGVTCKCVREGFGLGEWVYGDIGE